MVLVLLVLLLVVVMAAVVGDGGIGIDDGVHQFPTPFPDISQCFKNRQCLNNTVSANRQGKFGLSLDLTTSQVHQHPAPCLMPY